MRRILKGKLYDMEDYKTACAFLIGNEGNGLTEETAACADRKILIDGRRRRVAECSGGFGQYLCLKRADKGGTRENKAARVCK